MVAKLISKSILLMQVLKENKNISIIILLAFLYSVIYTVSVDYEKQKRNAEQTVNFEVF